MHARISPQIEHRLFSQITLGWRGRPLTSYDVIISTISAVTASTGLTVTAVLDRDPRPAGTEISRAQMKDLEDRALTRHEFHGERNYAFPPVPRPAPEPEPARPGRCSQAVLNHPALTGMDPADPDALAAALDIPFRARREQHLYASRRRGRVNAEGAGRARMIDLTDHVLALRIRRHLNLPVHVIAAIFGVHSTTISHAAGLTGKLLAGMRPPAATPPGIRLRTLDDLREYAAGHGITITTGLDTADTPPDDTITDPGTPRTHLILERLHLAVSAHDHEPARAGGLISS